MRAIKLIASSVSLAVSSPVMSSGVTLNTFAIDATVIARGSRAPLTYLLTAAGVRFVASARAASLVGVVLSNLCSRVVMEAKINGLIKRIEKHNCLVERTYRLEQNMAVIRRNAESLDGRMGRCASF